MSPQNSRRPTLRRPSPRALFIERIIATGVFGIPLLGTVVGAYLAYAYGVSGLDLTLLIGGYCVTLVGITLGYHRLFSHRSFDAVPALKAALAILGAFAWTGPVIRWAADHRRHHAFTDRAGDTHSPHTADGRRAYRFWMGHFGWVYNPEKTDPHKYTPDLVRDPLVRRLDSLYLWWGLLSLAIPPAIGWAVTGTAFGAFTAFIWGGLVRLFVTHHLIWSINSVCHTFGLRPYETGDQSRNHPVLGYVVFGEGWHNNHHRFQWSARIGIESWELDTGYLILRLFERLGWVWDLRAAEGRSRQRANA